VRLLSRPLLRLNLVRLLLDLRPPLLLLLRFKLALNRRLDLRPQ
jgi:hypothetical protein